MAEALLDGLDVGSHLDHEAGRSVPELVEGDAVEAGSANRRLEDPGPEGRAAERAELDEAIGPGRAVVGIKAVGEATLAGRTRILLVEDDLVYPARIVDGGLEPAGDPDAPSVIDDVVDELIEQALDLSGEVVIVGPGELGEHGSIAALLRY